MNIIEPGHVYQLKLHDDDGYHDPAYKMPSNLSSIEHDLLVFLNREEGHEHRGYQSQDVICALIDRTQHCDACLRWAGNDAIVFHLRMALALHECRAIQRKVQKGEIEPELVALDGDGHWPLREGVSRKAQRTQAREVQAGVRDDMNDTRPKVEPLRKVLDELDELNAADKPAGE